MKNKYIVGLLFLCFHTFIIAQEIEQLDIFSGNYDYTAFGNTMNLAENGAGAPCDILTSSSATFNLEADQTIIAAYLYWAGTDTGDFEVELNGVPYTAERTFSDMIDEPRVFFAAFADVTSQLQSEGPGEYTLSELDISAAIPPYCPSGTNFAGWAITVIFEDPDLPLNQINVFDGLQSVSQTNFDLTIELENLNVIDNEGAKIGFVAWEGDVNIAVQETLSINGNILSNDLNPANNQFNGTNSFTGSTELYNMDLDFYDIENNVNIGDTSATIELTSGQDFVMINNIITVLNSTLPDAIIELDNTVTECQSRDIEVTFTVTNQGSDDLPVNTPIAFYADGVFFDSGATSTLLEPGEDEELTIIITAPGSIPDDFELTAVVDDTGNGTGIIPELDEDNNESNTLDVSLSAIDIESPAENLIVCDDISNDGEAIFDLTINGDLVLGGQSGITITFHTTQEDAEDGTDEIPSPDAYTNTSNPQIIYIRLELDSDPSCIRIETFTIEVTPLPIIPALEDIEVCDDTSNDEIEIFDLTFQNDVITNGQTGFNITFHTSEEDAVNGVNAITNTTNYSNISNPETIYVRLNNPRSEDCFDTSSYVLSVNDIAIIENPLEDFIRCDDNSNDNVDIFDLTVNETLAVGGQSDVTVTFHTSQEDADNGVNAISSPDAYQNTANPEPIFLRIIQNEDAATDCFTTDTFFVELLGQPVIPQLDDMSICDDASNDGLSVFDLTSQESAILSGQSDFVISYHTSQDDADRNVNSIDNPGNYANLSTPQEIFIRLENPLNTICFDVQSFTITVTPIRPIMQLDDIINCNEGFEMAVFDLSESTDGLNLSVGQEITGYYLNTIDALDQVNAIEDPFAFVNSTSPQTIYVRLDTPNPDECYELAQFNIAIENCPPFIPDGFSPNDDGVNDTFEITGIKDIFDYKLYIYSRLGNLVYEGDNAVPFWDGTPNRGVGGSELPTGTYFWVLKLNNPEFKDQTGWVYLNR